ncbi:MAG: c-type cytochrome [Pseudomonadota bacterium]
MRAPFSSLSVAVFGLCLSAAAVFSAESGDVAKGEEIFLECSGCHAIGKGAEDEEMIGPHLNMLFGRKVASLDDFPYSRSLSRVGANGLEWHADTLDAYIEDPTTFASDTRMSYSGLENADDRAHLLAYLRVFSDDPANIPEADPTARGTDHSVDPEILALEGDAEYGEYLASECKTCHQVSGGDDGIPSIVLWPERQFVTAMHAYKDKVRPNPVMQMIAGRLNNEEIAALAAYFKDLDE